MEKFYGNLVAWNGLEDNDKLFPVTSSNYAQFKKKCDECVKRLDSKPVESCKTFKVQDVEKYIKSIKKI
jgi:hypothetical protein